ncbi:MFS transporter [Burkholderia sp. LMG 21824]|uniref:MFS transporter n=1 Tax=Burkholderia sp. LMG 21824 TaxID=3158172 RepID=UPI003C2B2860
MFSIGTDSYVVVGVLPRVSASFGVPVALAGKMVTLYALSFAVRSPVIAATAAYWPSKRLLLTGIVIFMLADVITAMASRIGIVLASRLLAGLGAAMFNSTATGACLPRPGRVLGF